jgi:hypothetical protein
MRKTMIIIGLVLIGLVLTVEVGWRVFLHQWFGI